MSRKEVLFQYYYEHIRHNIGNFLKWLVLAVLTGLIVGGASGIFAKCIGADALHPYQLLVDKHLVEKAHENGIAVNPWTVNKARDIKRLVACGVDGVITDDPKFAKKVIEEL